MVAITVAIAAIVYLWVAESTPTEDTKPAKTFALRNEGATEALGPADHVKTYMVAAAGGGAKYADIKLTLDGAQLAPELGAACEPSGTQMWSACAGTTPRGADDVISAGDMVVLRTSDAPDGMTLRLVDPEGNAVLYSLVVQ